MSTVKLKVNRWLRENLNLEPADVEEIAISVPDGESILGMIQRLATEEDLFWKTISDEEDHKIGKDVLVILNGRIVNPYDRSEAILQDGDEVMFLPMMAGG